MFALLGLNHAVAKPVCRALFMAVACMHAQNIESLSPATRPAQPQASMPGWGWAENAGQAFSPTRLKKPANARQSQWLDGWGLDRGRAEFLQAIMGSSARPGQVPGCCCRTVGRLAWSETPRGVHVGPVQGPLRPAQHKGHKGPSATRWIDRSKGIPK